MDDTDLATWLIRIKNLWILGAIVIAVLYLVIKGKPKESHVTGRYDASADINEDRPYQPKYPDMSRYIQGYNEIWLSHLGCRHAVEHRRAGLPPGPWYPQNHDYMQSYRECWSLLDEGSDD